MLGLILRCDRRNVPCIAAPVLLQVSAVQEGARKGEEGRGRWQIHLGQHDDRPGAARPGREQPHGTVKLRPGYLATQLPSCTPHSLPACSRPISKMAKLVQRPSSVSRCGGTSTCTLWAAAACFSFLILPASSQPQAEGSLSESFGTCVRLSTW